MSTDARWEWRTFGSQFGEAEPVLVEHTPAARESVELYLVSGRGDVNVKIRDGLLDVKMLRARDRFGLEQWEPILRAPFPIDQPSLTAVLARLGAERVPTVTAPITRDAFLDVIARELPQVAMLQVTKVRHGGQLDDCKIELADLTIAGRALRTLSIESASPARIAQLVRRLGLDRLENVNYVTALQRLLPTTLGGPASPRRRPAVLPSV